MNNLNKSYKIIRIANDLNLPSKRSPVKEILKYCHELVSEWIRLYRKKINSLYDLELLICEKLNLAFEIVYSDEDLERIIKKYTDMKEIIFASLKTDLDKDTFATTIKLKPQNNLGKQYIAIIDCRDNKRYRIHFSKWHEIAHLLTLSPQMELPFNRSTTRKDSIEYLMDKIAGEIGFFDPIFCPILHQEAERNRTISFSIITDIRDKICPEASFQSTLFACVSRTKLPVIYIEAEMGYKKKEIEILESGQQSLFQNMTIEPKLRAVTVILNESVKSLKFRIHKNMQIPKESIIYKTYIESNDYLNNSYNIGTENLSIWCHSNGVPVGNQDIRVEARTYGKKIIALIIPCNS